MICFSFSQKYYFPFVENSRTFRSNCCQAAISHLLSNFCHFSVSNFYQSSTVTFLSLVCWHVSVTQLMSPFCHSTAVTLLSIICCRVSHSSAVTFLSLNLCHLSLTQLLSLNCCHFSVIHLLSLFRHSTCVTFLSFSCCHSTPLTMSLVCCHFSVIQLVSPFPVTHLLSPFCHWSQITNNSKSDVANHSLFI
jgi:hypothetical protein